MYAARRGARKQRPLRYGVIRYGVNNKYYEKNLRIVIAAKDN